MRFFVFMAVLCLFPVAGICAQEAARFFAGLPDVPVMAGLKELPGETVVFDKPQGRIAEVVALVDGPASFEQIAAYYEETLPQLGWDYEGNSKFEREGEVLQISLESHEDQRLLKITVAPD